MDTKKLDLIEESDRVIGVLQKIDSLLRCGQFITADRAVLKLLSEIGAYDEAVSAGLSAYIDLKTVAHHLQRVCNFLQNVIIAYGENNKAMDAVKRGRKSILESMRASDEHK